eukprot:TRINITY_DN80710_c0_g1_i1.p1 TRINITY_DN80710_c0_g1~~TRINITY_DN80710_c0_g1_i1.p1  ORF type:complete len:596 (-),score=78.79 TRINITY_DN80710_c0_g1_i1:70-1836(-)
MQHNDPFQRAPSGLGPPQPMHLRPGVPAHLLPAGTQQPVAPPAPAAAVPAQGVGQPEIPQTGFALFMLQDGRWTLAGHEPTWDWDRAVQSLRWNQGRYGSRTRYGWFNGAPMVPDSEGFYRRPPPSEPLASPKAPPLAHLSVINRPTFDEYSISPNVLVCDDQGTRTEKLLDIIHKYDGRTTRSLMMIPGAATVMRDPHHGGSPASVNTAEIINKQNSEEPTTAAKLAKMLKTLLEREFKQSGLDNAFPSMTANGGNSARLMAQMLLELCPMVGTLCRSDPLLLQLQSPLFVMGDVHGNFKDLVFFTEQLSTFGDMKYTATKFLFLGDYVDRGPASLQVIAYLLAMKAIAPNNVFLLRGNHEDPNINNNTHMDVGPLRCTRTRCVEQLGAELGSRVWTAINFVFKELPIAAVVDGKIFCVHGGIPSLPASGIDDRVSALSRADAPRFSTLYPQEADQPDRARFRRLMAEYMWNDPAEDEASLDAQGFGGSSRADFARVFGTKAVDTFMGTNSYQFLIRAHEVKQEGLRISKHARIITVFSCSNYCGATNSAACIYLANGKIRFITRLPEPGQGSPRHADMRRSPVPRR